jgi:tetratricopeptide (TPR) repeat protein
MPKYLATGRSPEGRSVTEELDCDSADEAVRMMEQQGYIDVILHTDDVWAAYHKRAPKASILRPRDHITIRNLPRGLAHFVVITRVTYERSWGLFAIAMALLVYRRWEGTRWDAFDTICVVVTLSPIVLAFATSLFLRAKPYDALIEAVAWGRWEEVLERLDRGDIPVAGEELAFRRAGALAGLGRLDEAVATVEPLKRPGRMPTWLYWSRLAGVYFIARNHVDGLAALERAVELSPENSTLLIDLAQYTLQYREDVRAARHLLDRARSHALSDILEPAALAIEGQIALAEKRPLEARELLRTALTSLWRFRYASPLVHSLLDRIRAYLSVACAECGEMDEAKKQFRKAEPRLRALKRDDLIERCRLAIGSPPKPDNIQF